MKNGCLTHSKFRLLNDTSVPRAVPASGAILGNGLWSARASHTSRAAPPPKLTPEVRPADPKHY